MPKPVEKDAERFEENKKRKGKSQGYNQKGKSGFHMGKEQHFIYRPIATKKVDETIKTYNIFEKLNKVNENGDMKDQVTETSMKAVDVGVSSEPYPITKIVADTHIDKQEKMNKSEGASTPGPKGSDV